MDLKSSITSRARVEFRGGTDTCVGWHYPTGNGSMIVMASGLGVTRSPGTDAYAAAFVAAGFGVLSFDFRSFGDSGGSPRQVACLADMRTDLTAAIEFARLLPDVCSGRIVLWGFSLAGGLVIETSAQTPGLAAVIAQSPLVDGRAAARHAQRHQSIAPAVRLGMRSVIDALGARAQRPPRMVNLAGTRGTVALLTTPDAQDADRALGPRHRYPEWRDEVAARFVLSLTNYRPGRLASSVQCPLLIVASTDDETIPIASTRAVVKRSPSVDLVEVAGGHYAPFLESFDECVTAEIAFLRTVAQLGPDLSNLANGRVRA